MKILNINFKIVENEWKKKYPQAYLKFKTFNERETGLEDFVVFFELQKIEISFNRTDAVNGNYKGTCNFKVRIKNASHLRSLGRTNPVFSYYGLSSMEKAAIKGLNKAFEILECIIIGKEMPQAIRSSRKGNSESLVS